MNRVAPKKSLGQHFLADPNLLGVIERLAGLERSDIVLEVGPGLGALTRYLAERVRLVHAVEFDRSLEPYLRDSLDGIDNVQLHWGDALRIDLNALEPRATSLVANLPYNVATPIIAESLVHLPTLGRWCVMVQREVADRLFASPNTRAYGAVSVIVQLTSRKTGFHAVSRHVFRPPPRVESAIVAFERVSMPAEFDDVRRVVGAAFAHRRKTLANALALAGLTSREAAVAALVEIGRLPNARAESLTPREFVTLAQALHGA